MDPRPRDLIGTGLRTAILAGLVAILAGLVAILVLGNISAG